MTNLMIPYTLQWMFHPRTLLNIQHYVSFWSFIFFTPQQVNKSNSIYNHAWYQITCNMMKILSLKPCDTWKCLSVLQTSTPHQLTAVADTHTEHSQLPHIHVNSCTYRCTQCYVTQCQQYTPECLSWTAGLYYFCILPKLSNTSEQMIKNFIL